MNDKEIEKLLIRVNNHFNHQFEIGATSYLFCATKEHLKEYKYCYTISWCLKNESNLPENERTYFAGAGPLMVSKISEHIEMSASSPSYPTIDSIKKFEFKIRGLKSYWNLEIEYKKTKISTLKSLLNLNTPKILEKITSESKINITGDKEDLKRLQHNLSEANINSLLELKGKELDSTL